MQVETTTKRTSLILRIGIAIVFLYAGIASFLDPQAWIGFVPSFIELLIPATTFLYIHAVVDTLIALCLLSGKQTFYASIVSSLLLVGIIVFNLQSTDIIVRDISILSAAIALAVLSYKSENK